MNYLISAIFFVFVYLAIQALKKKNRSADTADTNETEQPKKSEKNLPINGAYQKKWLLSYNEKDAYEKIKAVTDEISCHTFSKVRLLDLLEPVKGNPKYKTYFYKVQAKHVDFVILDKKLVARCIIELDDSSHNAESRIERDKFVDEVLRSVGYSIIHTKAITEEIQEQIKEIMKAY